MKKSINKTSLSKRAKAFFLALAIIGNLLAFVQPPAQAAGPYTSNNSLDAAIDAKYGLSLSGTGPYTSVYSIDLRGNNNVFGDVDVDALKLAFPNLHYLSLDNTNVTKISNISHTSDVSVTYTDTFADTTRSFIYSGNTVVYRESDGALNVLSLLNEIKIITAGGNISIPTGMLGNGTVTLNSTSYSVSPSGTISQSNMLSNAAGPYSVVLNFPINYNTSTTVLNPNINLEIKKSGYFLSPTSGTVYDGGSFVFTLTKIGPDGLPANLGPQDSADISNYFSIYLYVSATHHLLASMEMTDAKTIKITVKAADVGSTSATLQIYEKGATPVPNSPAPTPSTAPGFCVQADLTKQSNAVLNDIRFVEYNTGVGTLGSTITSGGQIYINGGTTISSNLFSNLTGGVYTTTTMYYLQGQTPSSVWSYIPARYKPQITIDIGNDGTNPYDLSAEIIEVADPNSSASEKVLALVVTAKTASAISYSWDLFTETTKPVKLTLNNGGTNPSASSFMNVQVFGNTALGYAIYQVPDIYRGYTKQQIEDAIAGGDSRIVMVAKYQEVSSVWTQIGDSGATIVEDSSIYLVATAFYESNGQAFIVPDSLINGWYHTDTDAGHMFLQYVSGQYVGGGSLPTPATSMEAAQDGFGPGSVTFAAGTRILAVRTDGWNNTLNPEQNGLLVFAPKGAANYVNIPIKKIQKTVIKYIIAPPSYSLTSPATNIFEQLELEKAAGAGKLYALNENGKDTIAIGGTNHYEVWAVYSNYTVSNVFSSSVANGVTMTSAVSPVPVSKQAGSGDSLFDAVATLNGGKEDALVGKTVYMTYSDGTKSSTTIELTLTNSEINGLYLVFEDYLGNLYSSAPALYTNFSTISQLTPNFEIPQGTVANVYTVFAFGNNDFYNGVADWRTYIATAANVILAIVPAITTPSNSLTDGGTGTAGGYSFRRLNGVAASVNNTVAASWNGGPTVTIVITGVSTTFNVGTATSATEPINVINPIITYIAAKRAGLQVPNNTTISNPGGYIVGDIWDTDPDVRLTGGSTTNYSMSSATTIYSGTVTLIPSVPAAVDFMTNDYELGFKKQQTGLVITYEYTYFVNGVSKTVTLPAIGSTVDYRVTINVGHPTMDAIYLVAKNPSAGTLTWHDGSGIITGKNNVYTLPYASNSTIRLYPVALNSLVNLDSTFGPLPTAISEGDIAADPDYYSYIKASDFTQTGPWSLLNGNTSDYIGTPLVDGNGYIYYEVLFTGPVDYTIYLDFQYNPTALALTASAPYSTINTSTPATAQVFHMPDPSSAYVTDISATEVSPVTYHAGDTIKFDIKYFLSTVSTPGGTTYDVLPSYFNTTSLNVMPGQTNYNPAHNNALRVEAVSVPASGSYSLTSVGNQLQFTANVAGTYTFKLYTINNANLEAPYFAPRIITFTVAPYTANQTIYWGKVDPLNIPATITGWADIVEDGTSLLDPIALKAGMVKMASNPSGTATAIVKVKNAANIDLAVITVTTVGATATSAVLNESTSPTLPKPLANGESIGLYWVVTYTPADSTAPYTVNENIVSWVAMLTDGGTLNLSGSMLTMTVNPSPRISDNVFYQATYNGTIAPKDFFATVATTSPTYSYQVRNGSTAVTTLNIVAGSTVTLNVYDVSGTPTAVTGISHVDSSTAATLVSGYGTGSSFKVTGLTVGTSTVTVYPSAGGLVSITVNVTAAPAPTFSVSGTVVLDTAAVASGNPINITVTNTNGTNSYSATIPGPGGAFTVTGVPNGTYTVTATDNTNTGSVTGVYVGANVINVAITLVAGTTPTFTASLSKTSVSVKENDIATFSVNVSPTGTYTYQWYQSTNNGATWTSISGATNTSYSFTASMSMNSYQYRCDVTSGTTTVTSNTATLTVTSGTGTPNVGGGVGGGGATYVVTVNAGANGKASANKATAIASGTSIIVTATPDAGYVVDSVSAKTAAGASVNLTAGANGTYTFVMPAAAVTVTVTFKAATATNGQHICPSAPYKDVDITLWYHEYIDYVIENKIMQGTGPATFEPNINLTRAMLVQVLYNIENKPATSGGMTFDDVPADAWFADAIAWASANGVVNGYGNGNFGPNDSVTREQMAAMLYRYANYKGYDTSAFASLGAFVDAADVSGYAIPAMQWAVGAGLINGRDATHLVPQGTATRAEVSTIVTRFCRAYSIY